MDAKQPAPTRRICPLCRNAYTDPPALSRTDSKTPICPDCGSRQALQALGVATIGVAAVMQEVNWIAVGSAALLAGVLSVLTSVAGLPEAE